MHAPCWRFPTTRHGRASPGGSRETASPCARPSAQRRTAAPVAAPASTPVDPALAERARAAAERLTGLPARVSAGKLELHFGDETRLAELVEALESL